MPCCFRLSKVNNTCPSSSEQGDHSPAPTKHLPFMVKIPRPPWPPSKTSEPCWSCPGMVPTQLLLTVAKLGTHPTVAFFGKPHLPINSLLSPRMSPTGSAHGQSGHQPAKENERHCPHPGNFTRGSQGFRSSEQLGLGTQGLTRHTSPCKLQQNFLRESPKKASTEKLKVWKTGEAGMDFGSHLP